MQLAPGCHAVLAFHEEEVSSLPEGILERVTSVGYADTVNHWRWVKLRVTFTPEMLNEQVCMSDRGEEVPLYLCPHASIYQIEGEVTRTVVSKREMRNQGQQEPDLEF
jgi:hypothetical protein